MTQPAPWIQQIEDAAERGGRGNVGPCGEHGCEVCDWQPPAKPTPKSIVGGALSLLSRIGYGGGQ